MSTDHMSISLEELADLQDAFKAAGSEAVKEARTVTNAVGRYMKSELAASGRSQPDRLTQLVARQGLKMERRQVFRGRGGMVRPSQYSGGYVPTVILGLERPIKARRKATDRNPIPTTVQVWRGSEFGSNRLFPNGGRRFRPENKNGYWFYPAWRDIKVTAEDMWFSGMQRVLRKWSSS